MEVRALFQNHNFKSRGGEFFGYNAASATGSHNDKVHRSSVFEFLHGWYLPALSFFRVVVTEGRLEGHLLFESNQLPSGLIVVAAIIGARKVAHDGVQTDEVEKLGLLDGGEKFSLLRDTERRELTCARKHLPGLKLKLLQAICIGSLLILVERDEGAVDEIDDMRLAGTRCIIRGNDLRGDGFNFDGRLAREELEVSRWVRLRCAASIGLRRLNCR